MKFLRTAVFVSLVTMGTTAAFGQFGLYGSPEMLRLPSPNPVVAPFNGLGPVSAFPSARAPSFTRMAPADAAFAPAAAYPRSGLIHAAATGPPAEPHPLRATPLSANPRHDNPPARTLLVSPAPPPGVPSAGVPLARHLSLVDQMLLESGSGSTAAYYEAPDTEACQAACGGGEVFGGALGRFQKAITNGDCGEYDCGQYTCAPVCRSPWYGSLLALGMGRNKANCVWTTYETGNQPNQLTCTTDVGTRGRAGGEIRFGRRFCCDRWALEMTYWTIDAFDDTLYTAHASGVSTPITVGEMQFGGVAATAWFDGAAAHRLYRRNEFHNIELSLIRNQLDRGYGHSVDFDWSLGLRYFRFEENLVFSAVAGGFGWGTPAQEAYIDDQITNNLFGFQFGCEVGWEFFRGLRLFVAPRIGVYNNHIDHFFQAYLGDGTIATSSVGTGTYPVRSSTDALSFLTQIDLGGDWKLSENWDLRAGYRVMVITGVGLADNQIPPYIVDIPEIASIDINGELILHGAYAGLTYNF